MSRAKKILELARSNLAPANENCGFMEQEKKSNLLAIGNIMDSQMFTTVNDVIILELTDIPNPNASDQTSQNYFQNNIAGTSYQETFQIENVEHVINDEIIDNDNITDFFDELNNPDQNEISGSISGDNVVSMGLVPYSQHSDSISTTSTDLPTKTSTRKKRTLVNKETWFSQKNLKLREKGLKYLGRGRKDNTTWQYDIKKQPRSMKNRCSCKNTSKGNLKCSVISEADRKSLFDHFWNLTWAEKKTLIDSTVTITSTKRPRNRKELDISRRSQSILYYLRLNDNNIRVCRVMFLNTLCIGRMTVLKWKKTQEPENITIEAVKVKPFAKENQALIEFIKSLPTMESHYCRASSKKKYLLPEWQSKQSLYKFYVDDWCKLRNVKALSLTTFNNIIDLNNIALFHPKKDQCEKCSAYKAGHVSENEYILHINKKDEAREEKKKDKENESLVFTMDLQAVLMAPKSKVSSLYYKTKLCVHNLCFYNIINKDGFCYIWNETEGGVNAEEFATIISRFIVEKVLPTIDRQNESNPTKIILYSDGCTYQNRNVTVSNALLNVAIKENIIIEQKYLEVGHTQMEADSMHSTIERHLREKTVNVPAEYYGICREARKSPKKYDVTYLNHKFFKNFKEVEFLKSIRPGKKKGDPKVLDIRAIKYDADGLVYYKLRFTSDWELLPQRRTPGVTSHAVESLVQLHNQRLKIKKRKFDDLQALKNILADDYHIYYDSLPYD